MPADRRGALAQGLHPPCSSGWEALIRDLVYEQIEALPADSAHDRSGWHGARTGAKVTGPSGASPAPPEGPLLLPADRGTWRSSPDPPGVEPPGTSTTAQRRGLSRGLFADLRPASAPALPIDCAWRAFFHRDLAFLDGERVGTRQGPMWKWLGLLR